MPAVGSSRMRKSGSGSSARAKRSRCCSPPEHLATRRRARWLRLVRRRTVSGSCGLGKVAAIIATVSHTVRFPNSPPVCRTAPIFDAAMACRGADPKACIVPLVGVVSPRIMSISVDFPAPFGPSRAMISPCLMSRFTWLTARNVPLERSLNSLITSRA